MVENEVRSVLVVDDEVDACENLRDILTDVGYHVDTALTGIDAIEFARRRFYDVVLLDLKLPGIHGVDVYRKIKQLQPQIVAIVVSAFSESELAQSAIQEGAAQIVPKPVDIENLVGLLRG